MIRLFAGLALLSSVLAASAAETVKINGRNAHPTRVLAKYKANPDRAALANEAAAQTVEVKRKYSEIPGLAVVQVKNQAALKAAVAKKGNVEPSSELEETIRQLQGTGLFEYVEPDYVGYANLTPTDSAFTDGRLWGLLNGGQNGGVAGADINVVEAWDITTGDTNIVVAVIDTGINYTHRDLAAQMWRNPDEIPGNNVDDDGNGFIDDIFGMNAINDSGDPMDDNGHGTHCSGTIGAAANNGSDHVGVIWNVRIMGLKWLGSDGSGFFSDAIQCINYTIQKKVKITSNSWGGGGFSQPVYDAVAAARNAGQLFVAAAGNSNEDIDIFPDIPCSFDLDNIIAVAAIDRFDRLADFSNYGVINVDIAAPGVDIFSTWIGSDIAYNTIDGTSMACPHVAGAAALLLAADPTSDYVRLRDRIIQRGTPTPALAGKVASGARLNVHRAMSGQVDGILEITINPPSSSYFLTNSVTNVTVRVTDDFNVNNAVVIGRFNNATINFLNDGGGVDTNANDGVYTARVTMPGAIGLHTLTIDVTAPGKTPANLSVEYETLPKPPNDDFARADKIPLVGGIRQADNRMATTEAGEPRHAGRAHVRSLWWNWSTTATTQTLVDLAGTSFDDDAVLAVYTGSTLQGLTEVATATATANGPNGTRAPFVKFSAEPNLTYWIAVAQVENGTNSPGRVTLRLQPNGEIDTTPPTVRVTNYISGVFIRSRTNTITLAGVAEDPLPNASGIREEDGVQYKLSTDLLYQNAIGSTNWRTSPIRLTNGYNTILIKAFDRADNESATVQFTVNYIPQEISNDLLGFSETLTDVTGVNTGTTTNATREFGEPNHGGNVGGHSLWWSYMPPSDGVLLLTTEGSDFDTLLGLYTVNDPVNDRGVGSLIPVAQNDDAEGGASKTSELNVAVEGGRQYYIAVDGFAGQSGNVVLNYTFSPVSVFTLTTSTGPGGTITPGTGAFPANSAITLTAQPDRYRQLQSYTITTDGVTTNVTQNPYTFALTDDTTVFATFGTKVFTDDFESGALSPSRYSVSGGSTPHWIVDTVVTNSTLGGASRVARVRPNFPNSTVASLVMVTNLLAGLGSFEISVNTETNYDKVEFLLDGNVMRTWSGNVPWQVFTFEIPQKVTPFRLEWRYTKDAAISVNNEFVGIDNLDLPIMPPQPPGPIFVSIAQTATGLRIIAEGPTNTDFRLESTSDFVTWNAVAEDNSGATGTTVFNVSPTATQRFFRVVRL